jgi:hypothetical protein
MVLAPVSPVFHTMLASANYALESAMACRVFRAVRLGLIENSPGSALTTIPLHAPPQSATSEMAIKNEHTPEGRNLERSRCDPVAIEFTKTVEIGEGK